MPTHVNRIINGMNVLDHITKTKIFLNCFCVIRLSPLIYFKFMSFIRKSVKFYVRYVKINFLKNFDFSWSATLTLFQLGFLEVFFVINRVNEDNFVQGSFIYTINRWVLVGCGGLGRAIFCVLFFRFFLILVFGCLCNILCICIKYFLREIRGFYCPFWQRRWYAATFFDNLTS